MIKLAKPFIPDLCYERVLSVLESGNLIQGEVVADFEKKIAEYLQVPHAILVSSGTAALHLSLMALGIGSGDEVIIPAFTFPATANVIDLLGAKPVLVDIDLDDFCIDPAQIEDRISPRTKAIIPVHEFGQAAGMDSIYNIALKYNIPIIEDAACALGTEYDSKKAGTFGRLACFSLHPRKTITTGEGGIVVTKDDGISDTVRLQRNHGSHPTLRGRDFIAAGLNYRMTDIQAAIGIPQLKIIDELINIRIEQANYYTELLSDINWITCPRILEFRKNVYQTYHVLVQGINRDDLIIKLKEKGVETSLGAQAIHCLTYYKQKYGYIDKDFPNAWLAFNTGLALPIGHHISTNELEEISRILHTLKVA